MNPMPREAGRMSDYRQTGMSLRVLIRGNGDVALFLDENGVPLLRSNGALAAAEFSNPSGGGGMSPQTCHALGSLFYALIRDNRAESSGIPEYPVHLRVGMEQYGAENPQRMLRRPDHWDNLADFLRNLASQMTEERLAMLHETMFNEGWHATSPRPMSTRHAVHYIREEVSRSFGVEQIERKKGSVPVPK